MEKRFIFLVIPVILICLMFSGCQVVSLFQATPGPLETATPKLSLNQVTDIPTLPYITATPTLPIGSSVRYEDPTDIFTTVTMEIMPAKSYDQVVIFGTVEGFTTQTDAWGNTISTGNLKIGHHSGTEFSVTCDDFCFYTDARRNLIPSDKAVVGSEVIIFGSSDATVTDINADLIAVHTLADAPTVSYPDMSSLSGGLTYTEYELEGFPQLNPIRISGAAGGIVPVPSATPDPYSPQTDYSYSNNTDYGYGYYGYNSYGRPTSTPNRPPTETPTAIVTSEPEPEATKDLNDLLTARLNHTLANRTNYSYGAYGEQYSVYMEYEQDGNRDPKHPTRAEVSVESNGYAFTEYWIPYMKNPMFYNWGVVCYAGDWYLPLRFAVDIDPEPDIVDMVYCDRTIRSQYNYDDQKGYLRSFGHSIIDSKLFYFYQKEDGYGISINLQDYDLGFDDIPFGYVGSYTEIDPFYSDDLITFFGHRDGKWYYVEVEKPETNYYYY